MKNFTAIQGPVQGTQPRTDKPAKARTGGFPGPAESDPQWRKRAACRGVDPELWFPVGNSGVGASQAEDAKAVCFGCDVRLACGQWAMDTNQDHGVWGGLTEDDRRALKRRAARLRQKATEAAAS